MAEDAMRFTVITPSAGLRPRALALAAASVAAAAEHARLTDALDPALVEHLIGFDGAPAARPEGGVANLRCFSVPRPPEGSSFGNHVRDVLLRAARGRYLLFLDDDNALAEGAFSAHLACLRAEPAPELVIGRVDTSRAFGVPFLPRPAPEGADPALDAVRQGNIDPLCLCLARELVAVRCGGWSGEGGYESDFLNIRRYYRRARGVARTEALVGVYDAGRGLDAQGLNERQRRAEQDGL